MLLTLADLILTIGVNVQAKLSRFLLTVSVTCDFLGAAPKGAWLQARVDILRTTRNLAFGQGLLTLGDGTPVARISGILKIGGEPDPAYGPERYLR
jgi:acyl-coenzyme A thioesterase PaaI-like protein